MKQLFRIGQIVPSSNTTMETEIPAMLRAREALQRAARALDRARGPLWRSDADEEQCIVGCKLKVFEISVGRQIIAMRCLSGLRIEHHHRRHELGDGRDRRDLVGVLREERLPGRGIEHQHAGGLDVGLAFAGEFGRGDLGPRLSSLHDRGGGQQRGQKYEWNQSLHGITQGNSAAETIANKTHS